MPKTQTVIIISSVVLHNRLDHMLSSRVQCNMDDEIEMTCENGKLLFPYNSFAPVNIGNGDFNVFVKYRAIKTLLYLLKKVTEQPMTLFLSSDSGSVRLSIADLIL